MTASLESSRSSESSRPPLRTMASYSSFRPRIPTPEPPVVLPRPHSSATVTSDGTSSARSSFAESSSRSPQNTPALPPTSANSAVSLDPLDEDAEEDYFTSNARPTPSLSANHYVEPDLLLGISLAFTPPAISTVLTQMSGSMPNLITLPYGKYPALHLQAPSWRQMLKLMARLSGTRIEPTLEAITVAKHELKLRIVVQFVKVHHSSSDWRTVLYLTTDYPCPPNTNNAHKYTNGDVSVLPYSYTLSSLPTLLRDGAESPMAKYYVIPSTNSTPYPTLPINFPNLAMYLQSAVQDSRKAANDSSSGLRKLANYIDTCYPNDSEPVNSLDDKEVTRRGVGGMFKRVIQVGRNKPVKGRGNEEIYELVTPFVPDEWG
ncbi:hypothetical protein SERLA73DRAFT_146160 [Serpula lacrymans var. lacrymans S7.3]|uniref:Uncharacterized protein n=2 Tax=Serpula lacrymans var. lacrymans TaxID=341189 RepID=F8QF60_SERL3|nr:uncharacterized protein SERLADRAFT_383507 [Serpula lacrymans var. lacrymans S7.9]EGN93019.1 hypothetical protein SERLA73DRAFT_146160 [Serpula lacrymans var. lacrymans S7.3]EGO27859.1 hypothetical protein SERLADRAFT_383507 [Serpula lacrymans var. lacrymans S7.9]